MKQLLKEWKTWKNYQEIPGPFLELTPKEEEEELNASPSHKKKKTKHVLKDELKPVMQDLLHSIQGLYETHEEDSGEDMKDQLDLLTTKYTNLAEMCDFVLPRKPGPTTTGIKDGYGSSENESQENNPEDEGENDEGSDGSEA